MENQDNFFLNFNSFKVRTSGHDRNVTVSGHVNPMILFYQHEEIDRRKFHVSVIWNHLSDNQFKCEGIIKTARGMRFKSNI